MSPQLSAPGSVGRAGCEQKGAEHSSVGCCPQLPEAAEPGVLPVHPGGCPSYFWRTAESS